MRPRKISADAGRSEAPPPAQVPVLRSPLEKNRLDSRDVPLRGRGPVPYTRTPPAWASRPRAICGARASDRARCCSALGLPDLGPITYFPQSIPSRELRVGLSGWPWRVPVAAGHGGRPRGLCSPPDNVSLHPSVLFRSGRLNPPALLPLHGGISARAVAGLTGGVRAKCNVGIAPCRQCKYCLTSPIHQESHSLACQTTSDNT